MKLSTKGRYGVKAIVDLAINCMESPVSIKSIAERQHISEYYLEQLFSPLRKAGIIKSIRGAQGGYVMFKDPRDVTVAEILDVLEGPIEISECLEDGTCDNSSCCATRLLWGKLKDSIDNVTKSITLQDMIDDNESMRIKGVKAND